MSPLKMFTLSFPIIVGSPNSITNLGAPVWTMGHIAPPPVERQPLELSIIEGFGIIPHVIKISFILGSCKPIGTCM